MVVDEGFCLDTPQRASILAIILYKPYQERLNVRMGFEFPLKKKKSSQAK